MVWSEWHVTSAISIPDRTADEIRCMHAAFNKTSEKSDYTSIMNLDFLPRSCNLSDFNVTYARQLALACLMGPPCVDELPTDVSIISRDAHTTHVDCAGTSMEKPELEINPCLNHQLYFDLTPMSLKRSTTTTTTSPAPPPHFVILKVNKTNKMDFLSYMYSLNMGAKVYLVAFILCSMHPNTAKISTALEPLLFMKYLQSWLATITAVKYNPFYNEQFKKYLEDPSSTDVFDVEFKERPLIPVLLALCIHIKLLSIERDTPLLPGCDPSWSFENDKNVKVGSTLFTLGPEVIQSFSDKYFKPLSGENLRPGSVHWALPELLKAMGFSVRLHQNNTPKMDMGQFRRCLVLAIITESVKPNLRAVTRDELESMRGPLNSGNWSVHSITSMLFPGIMQALKKECQYRCAHPVPERLLKNHSIIEKVYKKIGATTEPIDPTCLDYIFEGGAANAPQGGAHAGAGMDEPELNEGAGDIIGGENGHDNYDAMDYAPDNVAFAVEVPTEAPGEAPAQPGNEPLAGPNQGPNPVRFTSGSPASSRPTSSRPTSAHPINSPLNAERLNGAIHAGSANPEHNVPKAPTACDGGARVEPDRTSALKRSSILSSEGSDIEIVSVAQVERPDAKTAESKRKRANKRQRSTDAGSQTNARGVGPHVRRTASQDPQPCTHCGATRIGKSEGSDVAGDSSVLFDDMIKDIRREMCREHVRREYMHWQRNNARRGPHMR